MPHFDPNSTLTEQVIRDMRLAINVVREHVVPILYVAAIFLSCIAMAVHMLTQRGVH